MGCLGRLVAMVVMGSCLCAAPKENMSLVPKNPVTPEAKETKSAAAKQKLGFVRRGPVVPEPTHPKGSSARAGSGAVPVSPPARAVVLSSPPYIFDVEFGALILQPTSSNLHYAAEVTPFPSPTHTAYIYEIGTKYQFGFDIGCSSVFHDLNTYLSLDWKRFYGSSSSTAVAVADSNLVGPFFEIGQYGALFTQAKGKTTFHFDRVDLAYGIGVHFGERLETSWSSGIAFGKIKQMLFSTFSTADSSVVQTIDMPSSFWGVGPQFGVDFSYDIIKGLRFTGEAGFAFLVGKQKNEMTYQSVSSDLTNVETTEVGTQTQLVPAVEGKLGLIYQFVTCYQTPKVFTVEAGYQAELYYNAIQSIGPSTIGVYAQSFQQTLSNFALAGPYVTVSVGF